MQEAMTKFQDLRKKRNEWSRTEETVFYAAEFASSDRGEFDVYHA